MYVCVRAHPAPLARKCAWENARRRGPDLARYVLTIVYKPLTTTRSPPMETSAVQLRQWASPDDAATGCAVYHLYAAVATEHISDGDRGCPYGDPKRGIGKADPSCPACDCPRLRVDCGQPWPGDTVDSEELATQIERMTVVARFQRS